jgi:hypothetical protein
MIFIAFLRLIRGSGLGVPGTKGEIAHLALDSSEVAPITARHNPFLENLVEDSAMKCFPPLRGE